MGAAAIVGNDRISQSTLDSQASNLQQDIAQYDPGVPVNTAALPSLVLAQLISFAVRNQTAQDLGVTVNQTDIDQAIQLVYQSDAQSAAQNGAAPPKSVQQLITLSAVPLSLRNDFGRYYAIELDFIKSKNGGKLPTGNSAAEQAAVQQAVSQFSMTECRAAKELNIQVNPQYGQLGFDQNTGHYTVSSGSDTLSAVGGSRPVTVLPYTPAC
jgi:hypothetical protein